MRVPACAWLATLAAIGCAGEVTGTIDPPDAAGAADAAAADAGADAGSADGGMADAGAPGALLGEFKLTYYYVTDEADYSGAADTPLFTPTCALIASVPAAFARSLAIEGTGRLVDDRVVNYAGSCGCDTSPCYVVLDAEHPWGTGYGGIALVPFRSVAVDRAVLDIGAWIYVAQLDGVVMPGDPPEGGFVHDGCVRADDTGGSIDGMHIDFFSALRGYYLALDGQLGLDQVTLYQAGARCPAERP